MKVLLIGDIHIKINKLDLSLKFLSWLNKLIRETKPDIVVNLGDSLDNHAVIRSEALNELMKHIFTIVDMGIPYVYVKGNHDQASPKESDYHALLPFKGRIKGLHIVDEVIELFGITFVPFLGNPAAFPKKTLPICIAHQTFLGADYGAINAKEGIDGETVEGADIIISGHIHKKSTIGKVIYVGSPFSQDASDINQVKGISVLDTDTLNFKFHPTPLPTWRSFKFELGPGQTIEQLHAALKEAITGSSDHWVLEVKGPKAEIISYIDSSQYLKLIAALSIRLKTIFTDKEKKKASISAVSMEHIVAEYINNIYSGSLNKVELLIQATEILEAVKSTV